RNQLGVFDWDAGLYVTAETNPFSPGLDLGTSAKTSLTYRVSENSPLFFSIEGSVGLRAKDAHQPAHAEFTPFYWGASFTAGFTFGSGSKPSSSDISTVRPKLSVSQPGDVYEREADRVAEQVMRMAIPEDAIQTRSQQRVYRYPVQLSAPAVTPQVE